MSRQATPLQKPNIHRFHLALERIGVDTAVLYEALGINPDTMARENTSISMLKYLELLELAAQKSGQRFLAIAMALDYKESNLGVLGYMLSNAATFEKALEILHRYIMLVSPGTFTSVLQEDSQCILTYKVRDIPSTLCSQDVEGTIAQFVVMIRILLKDDQWQPSHLYFEHSAPTNDQLKEFPFNSELVFDHFFNGMCFPQELMGHPLTNFDSKLLALLESQVQISPQDISSSDSLLERIGLMISAKLGNTDVSADSIAKELGMSRRTLNRRLKESGTTFNTLRENLVFHIAKESLCNSSVSITELAQMLGYSDSSAFNRAFKRMAKQRPLNYRKQHGPS